MYVLDLDHVDCGCGHAEFVWLFFCLSFLHHWNIVLRTVLTPFLLSFFRTILCVTQTERKLFCDAYCTYVYRYIHCTLRVKETKRSTITVWYYQFKVVVLAMVLHWYSTVLWRYLTVLVSYGRLHISAKASTLHRLGSFIFWIGPFSILIGSHHNPTFRLHPQV